MAAYFAHSAKPKVHYEVKVVTLQVDFENEVKAGKAEISNFRYEVIVLTCLVDECTYIHRYLHTYLHAYVRMYVPTYLHTLRAYIHYVHTYIHHILFFNYSSIDTLQSKPLDSDKDP